MLVCKYCLRREAVVRGEDGTIRGTVKVKGTLGRSAKCTYLKDLIIAHEECYLTVFLLTVNQLPRLSGRWVPGIPRGFHCGQPAPR